MSRRRTPAAASQPDSSFHLRWHSVANPGTASVDIMSSPDPLNDPATPDHEPSLSNTRRVTRSHRAHKFLSLGVSPRKQAYELDMGSSSRSSQRLVVSVETDGADVQDGAARRRLFPTPSPGLANLRERTTTTTVPLKYSIEDESSDVLGSTNATPRPRKTRVRTSNGTPIPRPNPRKRRAPTPPPPRTVHQPEAVADSMDSDSMSDAPMQRLPTPKRRALTPRKRVTGPSSELGTELPPVASSVRRGARRRRQALAPDELVELADVANNAALVEEAPPSEDDLQRDGAPTTAAITEGRMPTPASEADPESDIWMTTMSQDATPRASAQTARNPTPQRQEHEPSTDMYEEDYGYLAPAVSDVSSADDESLVGPVAGTNDTIAQGEDFSMIFMDSIPSLQASMHGGARPATYSELGEDTNLIINNTLESLRQGDIADEEDEGEEDDHDDTDTLQEPEPETGQDEGEPALAEIRSAYDANLEPKDDTQDKPASPRKSIVPSTGFGLTSEQEPEPEIEPESESEQELNAEADEQGDEEMADFNFDKEAEANQGSAGPEILREVEEVSGPEPEPIPVTAPTLQPPTIPRNLRLPQSPRKTMASSPLRHRVLKQSAGQAVETPRAKLPEADPSDRTPQASSRNTRLQDAGNDSMMYEDSFSEIPEAVLEAATPGRPGKSLTYEELNDEEMEEVMSMVEASQMQPEAPVEAEDTSEDVEQSPDNAEMANEDDAEEMPEEEVLDEEVPEEEVLEEEEIEEEVSDDEQGIELSAQSKEDEAGDPDWGINEEVADDGQNDQVSFLEDTDTEGALEIEDQAKEQDELAQPSNISAAHSQTNLPPTPDKTPPTTTEASTEASTGEAAPRSVARERHSRPFSNSPAQAGTAPQPTPRSHSAPVIQQAETAAHRDGSFVDETPRNQMSSPIQQPQSLVQEPVSAQHIRPALSSIVRAGRVLQSITSDPPSPEAGDRHLGSPFRSSASKESREESSERDAGRLASRSPSARAPSRSPAAQVLGFRKRAQSSVSPQRRSPFRERTRSTEPALASSNPSQTSVSPQRQSLFRKRTRSAEPIAPEEFFLPVQNEPEALQRSTLGRIQANRSLLDSPPNDGEMSWTANESTVRPSLRAVNSVGDVTRTSTEPAGRSFFSRSPVRPTFMPSEPEPEAEPESAEPIPEPAMRDDETDIWELEAERETVKAPRQQPFGRSLRRVSQTPRVSGPSPWMRKSAQAPVIPVQLTVEEPGSPSRQDDDAEEYSLLARQRAAEEAQKLSDSAAKASKFDLSTFFSSPTAIPGMLAEKFFPGRSKPAEAARAAAPVPARPAFVMATGNMFPQAPQMEFVPSSASRRSLFSAASPQQLQQPAPATERSESPATPEQLSIARAASANQTFITRPRQTSHTFAQPSSTVPTAASAATPPRMQLTHADIRNWQKTAHMSSGSSNSSEDSFVRPLLRPLPPKNASPTKSSLRSPLKPRTPGRVVEFTSSVLSPLEQANARNQRQASQSMLSASMSFFDQEDNNNNNNNNEDVGGYREVQHEYRDDKENRDSSDISMMDAPPLANNSRWQALSQTTWTRQHWLFLDELIQARRLRPFEARYERRSDKYLGKTVKSQGAAMQLERWHLDCVDAFKAEVGNWDEGVLAKRVFALLVGEERRREEQLQKVRRNTRLHRVAAL